LAAAAGKLRRSSRCKRAERHEIERVRITTILAVRSSGPVISCGASSTGLRDGSKSCSQRDVEAGVLGAGAVIGEVEGVVYQSIEADRRKRRECSNMAVRFRAGKAVKDALNRPHGARGKKSTPSKKAAVRK
jgi:hypothetical protein